MVVAAKATTTLLASTTEKVHKSGVGCLPGAGARLRILRLLLNALRQTYLSIIIYLNSCLAVHEYFAQTQTARPRQNTAIFPIDKMRSN
mmetsp:Transcript_615/g.818  ORF Transcript_615/g.818 Transcript_615/m.818 type:complete len:89 (+) Transcript_615:880-1146(+)